MGPGRQVDQASATLISMGQAVLSFLIVFGIVWLPLILAVLLIAWIVLAVARRSVPAVPARCHPSVLPTTPPSSARGLIEEDRVRPRRRPRAGRWG
jgi:hypothetical protein